MCCLQADTLCPILQTITGHESEQSTSILARVFHQLRPGVPLPCLILLQHILLLVSSLEQNVQTSATPSVWDIPYTSAMDTTGEANAAKTTQDTLECTEQAHHSDNSSNDIAREEVKLLKAQNHDVNRVCTAIGRGDFD